MKIEKIIIYNLQVIEIFLFLERSSAFGEGVRIKIGSSVVDVTLPTVSVEN